MDVVNGVNDDVGDSLMGDVDVLDVVNVLNDGVGDVDAVHSVDVIVDGVNGEMLLGCCGSCGCR